MKNRTGIIWKQGGIMMIAFVLLLSCDIKPQYPDMAEPPRQIPYLESLRIDGDLSDWPVDYTPERIYSDVFGRVPDSSDFKSRFRFAWNHNGLFILAEVNDDVIYEDPERFWNGDGLELFVSPQKGSFEIVQISVRPSFDRVDSLAAVNIYDHRRCDSLKSIPTAAYFCSQNGHGKYLLEGMIPLEMIGLKNLQTGMEMGIQLYLNDSDEEGDSGNYSLPWYPVRDSYRNPYAFHRVVLSDADYPVCCPEVRAWITDDKTLELKILSAQSHNKNNLSFRSEAYSSRLNLKPDLQNIYTAELNVPMKKLQSDYATICFFQNDSLFARINLSEVHRQYLKIPEPNRFEDEIRIFEIIDQYKPPDSNPILFTGSSTIRKWVCLDDDFPGLSLINRGFGGSTMDDLNYYFNRIVLPYKPSKIFVYEGDNDIARGASPVQVIENFKIFIERCNQYIPESEIFILSIKLSPSRERNWEDMKSTNGMLFNLAANNAEVHFIDINGCLLKEDGTPKIDLYESDMLHLNKEGYKLLAEQLHDSLYE